MAKNWIQGAIRHPGALTLVAHQLGILKDPGGALSAGMLDQLAAHASKMGNSHLARQVTLARTLMRMTQHG